jgi:NADPH:quinone reductase-like Zn-dependent oxidoreductase
VGVLDPRGGRLVLCGATTGADAKTNLRMLFFKNLSLLGSTMGSKAELLDVVEHVAAGRLKPVVHTVLPLARVADAHRMLADRSVFGKIVLTA